MKIKNLFAVAALLLASTSAFAQHVISPVTLVDNQGINYNVVEVYKNQNIAAGEINTVTVAITNDFSGATLNIPDEVSLTLNAGSKDENATPIEGAFTFRVIAVQEDAFRNNRSITTVNIGKYVANIGANAFNSCTGVTAINFAEGSALENLGEYCFGNTPKLTALDLDNCASLTNLAQGNTIGGVLGTPAAIGSPFHTSAANAVNNYMKTLKLNKVQTIGEQLASLTVLESVEFTELTALVANAFDSDAKLTTLELPAKCTAIPTGSLGGSSVANLTINCAEANAKEIEANVYTADANVLASVEFKGVFKGTIAAAAFSSTKLKSVKFAEVKCAAANNIAAGAFVLANDNSTVTIAKINSTGFAANAITGPANASKKVALNIGDVAVAIANPIVSTHVGAATTGKITAALDVAVFGDATSISFGEIAASGSVVSTLAAAVNTLTSVTFTKGIVANGIITGAFNYFRKLATVEFQANLTAGAVQSGAFGDGTANAGSANITASNPYRMTVIYKPTVFTKAFNANAFNSATVAAGNETVVLNSNMTFVGNAAYVALNDVVKSFAGETREIVMQTVSGQSTWYGKFVADGCNYAIATTNEAGQKVVVYEAYLDENEDTEITSIVMLPLTRDANYYIVKEGQAVIVRAWGEGNITAEATTADDTHNYYNVAGVAVGKNEIQYYEQDVSYNYLDVSVDASVLYDDCLAAGYNYMYAVKNLATSAFQWGQFEATAGLMPKYTLYVYTHFQGENPASGRLNVIWADGEDGEATAIQTVKTTTEDGVMYNLAGQKVDANYKGVVILNGKKMIRK